MNEFIKLAATQVYALTGASYSPVYGEPNRQREMKDVLDRRFALAGKKGMYDIPIWNDWRTYFHIKLRDAPRPQKTLGGFWPGVKSLALF